MGHASGQKEFTLPVICAFVAAFLAVVMAAGVWFYRFEKRAFTDRIEATLASIARLECDQISAWRKDQIADAAEFIKNQFLIQIVTDFMDEPTEERKRDILFRFRRIATEHNYADILLVDSAGRVRISLSSEAELYRECMDFIEEALRERRPVMTDLHRESPELPPHVSVVAPIPAGGENPAAALVFISDARRFLYPIIQEWPIPSDTAEVVLFRREGDHLLVLSELRHQKDTALNLRIPISKTDAPGVMNLLGKTGLVEGRDYRGVEVLAYVLPVPDSPWFIAAKIDRAEAMADWRLINALLLGLLACMAAFAAAVTYAVWKRSQEARYQALYEAESALRASVERQSVMLRAIGDAVIATDADGDVELMNPVAEALTGWKEEDARGRPLAEVFRIVNEETRAEVESPVDRVFLEGVVVGLANHTVLLSRDGREIPISDSGAPIRDESGAISGVILVFRDQTAERKAQARLLESEEMFRATFEQAAVGMVHLAPDGRILRANRAYREMTGYSADELSSMSFMDITPPEDRAACMDCMSRLMNGKALTCGIEKRQVCKDGSIVWVELTASVVNDDAGRPGYFVVSVKDITGRKEAERELRLLSAAVEQAGETIVVTDRDGGIQYVNAAFERTTGYTREEAVGQNPRILKSGKQPESYYRELWETISSGRSWRGRFVNRRKDGTLYTEDAFISPVFDESGQIVNYVGLKTDVTEHVKVQAQLQQAQKMESVGMLAGGVAHDFNNMLGVIMGYAELALSRIGQDSPVRAHLEKILSAAERSTGIIRQLLAFARRQTAAPVVLDINKTAEDMLKMLKRLIGEDIELAWLPASGLWPVKIDPAQVDQILANLCVNARDAIADVGKITIETANVNLDEAYCARHPGFVPGDYVMLAVSDTGCGMDKETLEKAFEPFFTTKEIGKGTGLGLSTVYGIVKQNAGFINIYSEPGKGTTVKIYLPRVGGAAVEIKEAPKDVPGGRGETVLVVEDDETILDLAEAMLEGLGYRVLRALTWEKAMELAGSYTDIRLLLTDVVMPGMNGRELAGRLSAIAPGLKVLYMSGYTSNVIAHHGVLDEGVKFLQKPFTLRDIAWKVREAIDA